MSLEQPNECKYSFKPLTTDRPAATLGGHLPPGRQAQTVAEPGLSIIGQCGSTERSGPFHSRSGIGMTAARGHHWSMVSVPSMTP